MILNEIFRRVEPAGRTMGEYFEQEMRPLGIDVFPNMKDEDLHRCFNFKQLGFGNEFKFAKEKAEENRFVKNTGYFDVLGMFPKAAAAEKAIYKDMKGYKYPDYDFKEMGSMTGLQKDVVKKSELNSALTQGNAKGLAKLAAFLANGGSVDGH